MAIKGSLVEWWEWRCLHSHLSEWGQKPGISSDEWRRCGMLAFLLVDELLLLHGNSRLCDFYLSTSVSQLLVTRVCVSNFFLFFLAILCG